MPRVFIAIGSNIEPAENVRKAIPLLAREARIVAVSTFYRTKPLDRPGQPDFYNGVVEIETDTPPLELKQDVLRRIEQELWRTWDADKRSARTIDLDIVVYGDLVLAEGNVRIPDPEIAVRPFLAIPLAELAPGMLLPDTGRGVAEIAAAFAHHGMEPLHEFTKTLRKESADGSRKG